MEPPARASEMPTLELDVAAALLGMLTRPTRSLSVDECGDGGCGVGLLAREHVAVDVERERDRRVAEAL